MPPMVYCFLISASENVGFKEFISITLILLHYCNLMFMPILCYEITH
jgi:hypothetical protein